LHFPHFCLALPPNGELLGSVASSNKQTAAVAPQPQPHSRTLSYDAFTPRLLSQSTSGFRGSGIMGPIKNLDALVEEHGPVVAFLMPFLALLATFFFLALVCR
jgi:hypothetical protein